MEFVGLNWNTERESIAVENSSHLLAVFVDPSIDMLDVLFAEAANRAKIQRKGVHWVRSKAPQRLPNVPKNIILNSIWLNRIFMYYGNCCEIILRLCTETFYKSVIPPALLLVIIFYNYYLIKFLSSVYTDE